MINRRVLAIILAITMATSASVSSGFDVFASEVPAAQEELTETEENILETVDEILDKKDEATEIGEASAEELTEENVESTIADEETAREVIIGGEISGGENDADNEVVAGDIIDTETTVVIATSNDTDVDNGKQIKLSATAEDGTVVVLSAKTGTFPSDDLDLSIHVVTGNEAEEASEEIDAVKPDENAAKRVTYDIKVISDGVEVQPVEGAKVNVSFKVADAPSGADDVTVYHHDEKEPDPVFIASAELSEDSETAVVGATAESGTEGAETNVVICNTDSDNTSAVTSSDASDDENYEDYELIDDVTVSGETTSFSYYTVDFTYDQKEVSIEGDTNHNELSKVLAKIGITEDIVNATAYMDEACTQPAENNTVTLDGKNLFKVYAEGGVWYVDAINAFNTTHGLLVKTVDAEYKVKVTDLLPAFTIEVDPGCILTLDDCVLEEDYTIRGDYGIPVSVSTGHYSAKIGYRTNGVSHYQELVATEKPGYRIVNWDYEAKFQGYIRPVMEEIKTKVTMTAGYGGTIDGIGSSGTVDARLYAPITINGDQLTIDSTIYKATPSDIEHMFTEWQVSPVANEVREGTEIKAVFQTKLEYTATLSTVVLNKSTNSEEAGTVNVSPDNHVLKGSVVTGNKSSLESSDILYIDGHTVSAKATPGYSFYKWSNVPKSITEENVILTAEFWKTDNPVTVKFFDPQLGRYETNLNSYTEGVKVPQGAKIYLDSKDDTTIKFGEDNCYYVTPIPGPDFAFLKWVDENGNELKFPYSVQSDLTIHPIFVYNASQYLSISAVGGGKLLYNGNAKTTISWIIDGMYGTKVTVDSSDESKLNISYYNSRGEHITEYVTAVPDSGYKFASTIWTGLPESLLQQSIDVKANFTENMVKINFSKEGNGAVKRDGKDFSELSVQSGKTITVYGSRLMIDGDPSLIIASPSSETDVFDRWEGIPDSRRIDSDTTIKAVFNSGVITHEVKGVPSITTGGTVYPKDPVRIASGSQIGKLEQTASSSQITIGNQDFTAVSNDGYYFTGWIISGGTLHGELNNDITLTAEFVNTGIKQSITLATADHGTYEKSFTGDTLTVPAGTEFTVKGDLITAGLGTAYIRALPDKDCRFEGWFSLINGVETKLEDDKKASDSETNITIYARFDYNSYPDPSHVDYPTGSSGSGAASTTDLLDRTNYHAEHTYGSWDNPINDGVWEQLANGNWVYNSSTPMKNCWACIVNPYANVDKGQHAHDWFFFDPYGHMMTGWRMIDGKWYYFEPISNGCRGGLYMSTTTPDGYAVDANGAWIQ